jgi:excinuclease UvrABC nuclease subunit
MASQLWLIPPPRTLAERFGDDFFRALPERPGVYLFCGQEAGVLYVGKAKNLRKRLGSYRVANPERFSRRMIRLINLTLRIEFDICPTEASATHREAELICALAPQFNRAGKAWPRS